MYVVYLFTTWLQWVTFILAARFEKYMLKTIGTNLMFIGPCIVVSFGMVGVVSVLYAETVLQHTTRIPLQPNHTETPTNIEPRTIRPMW